MLIVIDMQNDFINGSLGNKETNDPKFLNNVKTRVEKAFFNEERIIFSQDTHCKAEEYLETAEGKHLPVPHCEKGKFGWNIIDSLASYSNKDNTFEKSSFAFSPISSMFLFLEAIETAIALGDETFEFIGVSTDICVIANVFLLRSFHPNINIQVNAECCAGTSFEAHRAALTVMNSSHIKILNDDRPELIGY